MTDTLREVMAVKMKIATLALILLFFTSCSRTQVALRLADDFLAYEISDQFELSGIKEDQIEKLSEDFVKELKVAVVPLLIQEIQVFQKLLKEDKKSSEKIYQEQLSASLKGFEEKIKILQPVFQKYSQSVVSELEKENWNSFLKEFEKRNQKILKEKDQQRMQKNLERFFGKLNQDQIRLVTNFYIEHPLSSEIRVANRRATLASFNKQMGSEFNQEKLKRITQEWVKDPDAFGDPRAAAFYAERREKIIQVIAQILFLRTQKQEEHVLEKLVQIEQDLQEALQIKQ